MSVPAIQYKCSCDNFSPIYELYFCRNCLELKCFACTVHEVQSQYCPQCSFVTGIDGPMKSNKCPNCLECPICHKILIIHATERRPDGSKIPELNAKLCYLACSVCGWNSRNSNVLTDQILKDNVEAGWYESTRARDERLKNIVNYYKNLCDFNQDPQNEALDISHRFYSLKLSQKAHFKTPPIPPTVPPAEEVPIDDLADILTTPPDLSKVLTVRQRMSNPGLQAKSSSESFPLRKMLISRTLLRCAKCEKNLLKQEFKPQTCRFSVYLTAVNFVPLVKLVRCEREKESESFKFFISVENLCGYNRVVSFSPLDGGHVDFSCKVQLHPYDEGKLCFVENSTFRSDVCPLVLDSLNKAILVGTARSTVRQATIVMKYNYECPQIHSAQPIVKWISSLVVVEFGGIRLHKTAL